MGKFQRSRWNNQRWEFGAVSATVRRLGGRQALPTGSGPWRSSAGPFEAEVAQERKPFGRSAEDLHPSMNGTKGLPGMVGLLSSKYPCYFGHQPEMPGVRRNVHVVRTAISILRGV